MIFCYSNSGNTKKYAGILADVINAKAAGRSGAAEDYKVPLIMLESPELEHCSRFTYYTRAVFKKSCRVTNMPGPNTIDCDDIYICGPIWAGRPAGPIRFFLENVPFKGTRVHMLLTAAIPHDKYATKCEGIIKDLGYTPGQIHVFAAPKGGTDGIDYEVAESHIRRLYFNDDTVQDIVNEDIVDEDIVNENIVNEDIVTEDIINEDLE